MTSDTPRRDKPAAHGHPRIPRMRWSGIPLLGAALAAITFAAPISNALAASPRADKDTDKVAELPGGMTYQPLSEALFDTISEALPESRNVNAEFLNPAYDPVLPVSQDANLFVTFVDEGAGYRNSLGYFSFQTGSFDGITKGDIDIDGSGVVSLDELGRIATVQTGWVFPNASAIGAGGLLAAGDTVTLGDGAVFTAGTSVGFFLAQNAWTGSSIRDTQSTGRGEVQYMYSMDFLNPEAQASASLLTDSSTNSSRHVAMLFADGSRSEIVMGFEDLNRIDRQANESNFLTDEDFNDAIFIVSSNPIEALQQAEIATAPGPILGGPLAVFAALGFLGFRRLRRGN